MLDKSALQQLSQLKQSIRSEKNLYAGTVRGSQGRFGFVRLDDGREGFLPPDVMSRVLPGDRVEVSVQEKAENAESSARKVDVELDKLLSTGSPRLVGQYIIRGKGHFIAVDLPQFTRWIFLAPKDRGKAREGDYIVCKLTRHPFADGKGQARVQEIVGKPGEIGIEHKLTCLKYNLPRQWSKAALKQAETLSAQELDKLPDFNSRQNLKTLGFVTIDSESTLDMDDALHLEAQASGWLLRIAIADPTAAIDAGSALDEAALKRANTTYLPGQAITMLPEVLSHNTFSLRAGELRPALLCELEVENDGSISSYRFGSALIRSHHKLSYDQVGRFLDGDAGACPDSTHTLLQDLADCSNALRSFREQHMLLMDERDDYDLIIGEDMHIAEIRRQRHNRAQQVVEESMLAVNRCAGDFFASRGPGGIFSAHDGFRPEKVPAIREVLKSDFPELANLKLETAAGYRRLISTLQARPDAAPQLAALRLRLQPGRLSLEPAPHLGLAMQHYATITSPIRRYNDFYNHRALRKLLQGSQVTPPTPEQMTELQESIAVSRNASRDLEQWLMCLFMQEKVKQQQGKQQPPLELDGHVFRVTSQGVTVRLSNWGVTGFVKLDPKAWKFDESRLTLTNENDSLYLNQPLRVRVERIDLDKKRMNFTRVDSVSGLADLATAEA